MEEEQLKKLFGQKIRQIRKKKNLTQEKLAELVWMDTQHLCKMENGNHFPSLKNLIKLSKVLEVNIEDLFIYEDSKENELLQEIKYNIGTLTLKELDVVHKMILSIRELRQN